MAFLSKRLSNYRKKNAGNVYIEELKIIDFNNEKLLKLFKRLEFKSFIDKFKINRKHQPKTEVKKLNVLKI